MTFAQILTELNTLSLDERLKLLEALTHSLQGELHPRLRARKGSSLKRVLGVLRPAKGEIPGDAELKDDYINHLVRKHQ
jgi:hypothetical protein